MRVGIHQPNYIPWLGYFHKIAAVDTFVFFDNVQMPIGKSFVSRNRIKTNSGELWLTVPTARDSDGKPIAETQIVPGNWSRKHVKSLETAYPGAAELKPVLALLGAAIGEGHGSIADLNVRVIAALAEHLGYGDVRFLRATEMGLRNEGAKTAHEILKLLGAKTYVTGMGAGTERTIDPAALAADGIAVQYLPKVYPEYPQRHGSFLPNLSIVDAILNCGATGTRSLLATAT